MSRLYVLFIFLPVLVCCQHNKPAAQPALATVYTQAIGDFITAANKQNKTSFDTLYIGKRVNGQPDDFPDITLPATINHTVVKLVSPEEGTTLQNERRQRIYINMVGWVEPDTASFIFVVFSNGFAHQYDYTINYQYNSAIQNYNLKDVQFTGPPFK